MKLQSLIDSPAVIGARIQKRRRLLGLTQEALAEAIGISVNYLGQIERGRRPLSLALGEDLCLFFGMTLDELYCALPKDQLREECPAQVALQSRIAGCSEEECRLLLTIVQGMRSLPGHMPAHRSDLPESARLGA